MTASIAAGFTDPVGTAQRHFRAVLEAMSAPGRIVELEDELPTSPGALAPAAYALALALLDYETPIWLDPPLRDAAVTASLRFHTGCPVVEEPARAAFAFAATPSALPPLACFAPGEPEYPDRSTTLVLQVDGFRGKPQVRLRGPGIRDSAMLAADGPAIGFWHELAADHRRFPQGIDLVLVAGWRIAALPRSTVLEVA